MQCRLCFLDSEDLQSIYLKHEIKDGNKSIVEIIQLLSGIEIVEDEFSQQICTNCLSEVLYGYEIRQKIIESDMHLKSYSKQTDDNDSTDQFEILYEDEVVYPSEVLMKSETPDEELDEDDEIEDFLTTNFPDNITPIQKEIFYTCNDCNPPKEYNNKNSYRLHMKKNHETGRSSKFACFNCDRSFKSAEELDSHNSQKVLGLCSNKPTYVSRKCYLCNLVFKSREMKFKHLEVHKDVEMKCSSCNYETKFIRSFDRHLRFHENGFQFFCEACGKNFYSRGRLRLHTSLIHTNDIQKLTCDICGRDFRQRSHILLHMKTVHLNQKNFKCNYCKEEKRFSSLIALNTHLFRKHNVQAPISCDNCNRGFTFKSQLEYHQRQRRQPDGSCAEYIPRIVGKKPQPCSECGKIYKTYTGLRRHMDAHKNLKPFKCEFCEKKFSQKPILEIHRRIHTGERPFSCPECHKEFADPSRFRRHKNTAHPHLLIYQCEHCHLKFMEESSLHNHTRKVHGRKINKLRGIINT